MLFKTCKYICDLLFKANMYDCKPISTPMSTTYKLSISECDPFDNPSLYRNIAKSLYYITITRPDLSSVVNKIFQFMACPFQPHWCVVKMILRYLHDTTTYDLVIRPYTQFLLQGFVDVDWVLCLDDRRSTFGSIIHLDANPIIWLSKKLFGYLINNIQCL